MLAVAEEGLEAKSELDILFHHIQSVRVDNEAYHRDNEYYFHKVQYT